jgi:hypothetical protein
VKRAWIQNNDKFIEVSRIGTRNLETIQHLFIYLNSSSSNKLDLAMSPYQALIFGASGITGWSLLRECLTYPTKDTFSRVIGLTNRPLNARDAMLPDDSRWELHSGMDLTKDVEDVVRLLKGIEGIEKTTHVYFACMMMAFTLG